MRPYTRSQACTLNVRFVAVHEMSPKLAGRCLTLCFPRQLSTRHSRRRQRGVGGYCQSHPYCMTFRYGHHYPRRKARTLTTRNSQASTLAVGSHSSFFLLGQAPRILHVLAQQALSAKARGASASWQARSMRASWLMLFSLIYHIFQAYVSLFSSILAQLMPYSGRPSAMASRLCSVLGSTYHMSSSARVRKGLLGQGCVSLQPPGSRSRQMQSETFRHREEPQERPVTILRTAAPRAARGSAEGQRRLAVLKV
jgi:hypothetical protein